jgi:hypothetical protein
MQVANLFINGSIIITNDQPILGEDIKLSLDRDFTYSCVDTKMDIEVKFYCASGKTQIDLAYEEMGIDADGEIEIVDDCGNLFEFYKFKLDFKSYKSNSEFTTLGIIDLNSQWKNDLTQEKNLKDSIGDPSKFYIRNLPLSYKYESEYFNSKEISNSNIISISQFIIVGPFIFPPSPNNNYYHIQINPENALTLNELEDGYQLFSNQVFNATTTMGNSSLPGSWRKDTNGTIISTSFSYTELEPQEIFENKLDDGVFNIETKSFTGLFFDLLGTSQYNSDFSFVHFIEHIAVGDKFENCVVYEHYLVDNILDYNGGAGSFTDYNYTGTPNSITNTISINVPKDYKVWIWYSYVVRDLVEVNFAPGIPFPSWFVTRSINHRFDKYSININRSLTANFTIAKNTSNVISSIADIEPYHTETKAYNGSDLIGVVFGTDYNLCQTPCFVDLWFSRGDYLRNKVNVSDFIVKPSDFFAEFEKVVCCGLGYFYFNNGMPAEKRLMSVYDFYTDNVVPSQYIFNYPDLIDGEIKIDPFLSTNYKEIQIGYSNSKDTAEDVCKQNSYTIPNRSETIYSKVSDFIASMFIVTKALKIGTDDKELEFDKNIFILSGTTIPASPANYNVTLSQSAGFLADNVELSPTNTNGINRRYATVFNLFRHLYKWGFSLFSNKDTLRVVKYEGSSIYDLEILDSSGVSTNPYYPGLSDCKLPALNFEKVDRTVNNMYDIIQSNMYVPSVLTFSTAKLSTFDLIAMRAFQYDLFQVSDGTNTYYGNLISANLVNDVTEIKLLRRFKNGI